MMLMSFNYISKNGSKKFGTMIMAYTQTNIDLCKQNAKNGLTPSGKHKLKSWNLHFFKLVEI